MNGNLKPGRAVKRKKILTVILSLLALSSRLARPAVVKMDEEKHRRQNSDIEGQVRKFAVTGDWLVTRGYHITDNLVANATSVP